MNKFTNKSVLITGASAGIGRELVKVFGAEGAMVSMLARRKERLDELAAELSRNGYPNTAIRCDVTSETETKAAIDATIGKFGKLDVVIANAGFGVVGLVEKLSVDDYRRQFETNVYGVLHTIQLSLPHIIKTKGQICMIGSIAGHIALPKSSPYSMSKFAIRALSEALYYEMKPYGVSVTLISPGFVKSEIRKVDNHGVYYPDTKDKPPLRAMDTATAAHKIMLAVWKRKKERIITAHGWAAVWLNRHFPEIFRLLICGLGIKARGT